VSTGFENIQRIPASGWRESIPDEVTETRTIGSEFTAPEPPEKLESVHCRAIR